MACGCSKNRAASRGISGPRQVGAARPVARSNRNVIVPSQAPRQVQTAIKQPQNIVQTGSTSPAQPRSASGEHLERRKIQQIRRNVVRKNLGK